MPNCSKCTGCSKYKQSYGGSSSYGRSTTHKSANATCTVTSIFPDESIAIGSGFFIKQKCKYYVVTCAHIVEINDGGRIPSDCVYIDVQNVNKTRAHRQIKCKVVGLDRAADIAVLCPCSLEECPKDGWNLTCHPYLCFGNSTTTKHGEKCVIIGNSLGVDPFSVADGVVRDNKFVLDLPVETMLISAPAWSGNSGSPILNKNGKVIGMICFTFREAINLFNITIPFVTVAATTMAGGVTQFMMEQIVNLIICSGSDYTEKGFLGIREFTTISDYVLASLRLDYPDFLCGDKDVLKGIVVENPVDIGVIAARAAFYGDPYSPPTVELLPDDIITKIKDLDTCKELCLGNLDRQYHPTRMTWFKKPGDQVEITFVRPSNNTTYTSIITLGRYPPRGDRPLGSVISHEVKKENEEEDPEVNISPKRNIGGKMYTLVTSTNTRRKKH
jgi:Trypsin-like peptidase domain